MIPERNQTRSHGFRLEHATNMRSIDELESLCKSWQGILRLSDWKIKIAKVHRHDIDNCVSRVHYRASLKDATIKVVFEEECEDSPDIEINIVHELLHLHFWNADYTGTDNDIHEQAIDLIAQSLVMLSRNVKV